MEKHGSERCFADDHGTDQAVTAETPLRTPRLQSVKRSQARSRTAVRRRLSAGGPARVQCGLGKERGDGVPFDEIGGGQHYARFDFAVLDNETAGGFRLRHVAIGRKQHSVGAGFKFAAAANGQLERGDISSSVRMLSKAGAYLVLARLEGNSGRRNEARDARGSVAV